MLKKLWLLWVALLLTGVGALAQESGRIVEEIVARVNSEIITRGEFEQSRLVMTDEVRQECPSCTDAQVRERIAEREKNLLRDLIDNTLLAQRGKDLGISVDVDVVRRLDEVRRNNGIESMEELERRVTESGLNYQDFQENIRNQLLTEEVIRREVSARIMMEDEEIEKYYEEHKDDFVRPEQVVLREIFVSTSGKPESEVDALRREAEGLLARVRSGEDFGELAKRFSDGSTAPQGGNLGAFERGQLSADLEAVVFDLARNQVTDVIPTPSGFLILQVLEHYEEGLQPQEKVENEIMNVLYEQKIRPAMREYLTVLREESFIEVKPGYVDTGSVAATGMSEPASPSPVAGPDANAANRDMRSSRN